MLRAEPLLNNEDVLTPPLGFGGLLGGSLATVPDLHSSAAFPSCRNKCISCICTYYTSHKPPVRLSPFGQTSQSHLRGTLRGADHPCLMKQHVRGKYFLTDGSSRHTNIRERHSLATPYNGPTPSLALTLPTTCIGCRGLGRLDAI